MLNFWACFGKIQEKQTNSYNRLERSLFFNLVLLLTKTTLVCEKAEVDIDLIR